MLQFLEKKEKMNMAQRPEILAPAGSLEKLKVAFLYGANAVYLAGQRFGLRAAAENFTLSELEEGVQFAHGREGKVYVVLNSFFHQKDFEGLYQFLQFLEEIKVDALIISDLGVVHFVHTHFPKLVIHLSTQASCLNSYAASFWKSQGVTRIVLGREVTLEEAKQIKKKTGLEIEMFIHGSMCMSYSGHCVISNYTQGRDSNRGGCAHSCRFEYKLKAHNNPEEVLAYFMSSKDLEGLATVSHFFKAGVDSVKIEGRMKSALYAATTSKVYKEALDYFASLNNKNEEGITQDKLQEWGDELKKFSHRDYSSGSLLEKAGASSIYNKRESEEKNFEAIGTVYDLVPDEYLLIQVRNKFSRGENLELLPFVGRALTIPLLWIKSALGKEIESTRPGSLVRIPYVSGASRLNILRRGRM